MLVESDVGAVRPVLSDGTLIDELVDVEAKSVALRALIDAEIYQLELRRIFAKAWVAVAHVSELPHPGDYVSRHIGDDPVIVTRDRTGTLQVLLNICSHRGQQVCWTEMGNSRSFRCAFHGWIYDGSGALIGVPFEKDMFGDALDPNQLGLRRARVDTCGGWIFATWDESAPPLGEYLGSFEWYVDTLFCRTDKGLEVAGPPQRQHVKANWKIGAEGLAGDGYHVMTLHRSLAELGVYGTDDPRTAGMYTVKVSDNGHGLTLVRPDALLSDEDLPSVSIAQTQCLTPELTAQAERNLTPDQLRLLLNAGTSIGNIFPNLAWVSTGFPDGHGGLIPVVTFRIFQPRGADGIDVLTWSLVETDAPDYVKQAAQRMAVLSFGDSGLIEQDDAEGWEHIQRGAQGVMAREQTLKYLALTGENRSPDWPGGGYVQDGYSRDDNQWLFWNRWLEFLTGAAW